MNRLRSVFAVTLRQIKASVLTGAIFAAILAMDETAVGLFVSGGQYQPHKNQDRKHDKSDGVQCAK